MDNSNQNDPNNPNPNPSPFAPPTAPDPMQQQPSSPWPSNPVVQPTFTPPAPPEPLQTQPEPHPWPNPPQPEPQTPFPAQSGQLQTEQTPSLSPLDNPWGSSIQTPPLDGSTQNPSPIPDNTQPSWAPLPATSAPQQTIPDFPAANQDSAPTDLSHLISNQPDSSAQMTPETLVVPSGAGISPEVSVPTENHKGGIPKWVIGVGIGLILVVAAASAYFILGIGQPSKTTSLPATTTRPPATVVTRTPEPTTQPAASESADFGELQGNAGTNTATSAADLIRQRQQGL